MFGAGGNIQIATRGLFLSRNSRITASSNFGVNGVVDMKSPEVDPSSGVVILPEEVVDVSGLVAQGCVSPLEKSGVVGGKIHRKYTPAFR